MRGMHLQAEVLNRRPPDNVEQVIVPKARKEEFLRIAKTKITGGDGCPTHGGNCDAVLLCRLVQRS